MGISPTEDNNAFESIIKPVKTTQGGGRNKLLYGNHKNLRGYNQDHLFCSASGKQVPFNDIKHVDRETALEGCMDVF